MASITVQNTGDVIEASPAVSILNNLLQNGVSISHVCGGRAQCGTCRFEVITGERYLSPQTDIEKRKLELLGNPEKVRLACQTHTFGDITIRIIFSTPPGRASV
ncbi:MAG: 2Fe-2S iron-sulfur cluster-binding protein [Spirochaetia bacterium]